MPKNDYWEKRKTGYPPQTTKQKESLFPDWEKENKKQEAEKKRKTNSTEPEINGISLGEMIDYLVDHDYERTQMTKWSMSEVIDTYKLEKYEESEVIDTDEYENETLRYTRADMTKFLIEQGYESTYIHICTDAKLIQLVKEEEMPEYVFDQEEETRETLRIEIISMLVGDNIISEEKLEMMSDENLLKFVEEIYGEGIVEDNFIK
jgi:hypothetical protein